MLYVPTDQDQAIMFREALNVKVSRIRYSVLFQLQYSLVLQFSAQDGNHSIWMGVKLSDDFVSWFTVQGVAVDGHNADWAVGQPGIGWDPLADVQLHFFCISSFAAETASGSKRCAVAKKSLGYKWEAAYCLDDSIEFICSLRAPSCPSGYTWIPETGENCFKPSIAGHYEPAADITQASAGIT